MRARGDKGKATGYSQLGALFYRLLERVFLETGEGEGNGRAPLLLLHHLGDVDHRLYVVDRFDVAAHHDAAPVGDAHSVTADTAQRRLSWRILSTIQSR